MFPKIEPVRVLACQPPRTSGEHSRKVLMQSNLFPPFTPVLVSCLSDCKDLRSLTVIRKGIVATPTPKIRTALSFYDCYRMLVIGVAGNDLKSLFSNEPAQLGLICGFLMEGMPWMLRIRLLTGHAPSQQERDYEKELQGQTPEDFYRQTYPNNISVNGLLYYHPI